MKVEGSHKLTIIQLHNLNLCRFSLPENCLMKYTSFMSSP